MVKIAYILTPIEFGGLEKVSLTFLKNVNREQYDIHLILLIRPWEEDNTFINFIKSYDFSITTIPVARWSPTERRDYLRVARCVVYLYRILSKGSFDVVHSHGYFADIITALACKFLKIPHISTCHGFIANDKNLKIYNILDRFMLRSCGRIIAVSSGIMSELVRNGINASRVTVIQNAVDCSDKDKQIDENRIEKRNFLSIDKNKFLIGYVGRLSEEKGVNYLIEAASMLKQLNETFNLVILGDGPKKSELCSQANSKGLDNEIIFTGFQKDIDRWLPALDVFVLPSLTEGTPMALLEAMSMGIPVIASAVGGVPGIIKNGVNGFLLDPGDYKGLSETITLLINDPPLRKKLAAEGVHTIKEMFDVNKWCRKIESEYNSLLRKEKRGMISCG